ncbi:hypothetical protein E4U54_002697 [Claviceps lovelessii]|nr:hypothetical protein E4U54_002697 [Claviceps lovelessii]
MSRLQPMASGASPQAARQQQTRCSTCRTRRTRRSRRSRQTPLRTPAWHLRHHTIRLLARSAQSSPAFKHSDDPVNGIICGGR